MNNVDRGERFDDAQAEDVAEPGPGARSQGEQELPRGEGVIGGAQERLFAADMSPCADSAG